MALTAKERYERWKQAHPGVAEARAKTWYDEHKDRHLASQQAIRGQRAAASEPLPEVWPYGHSSPHIAAVNGVVPRNLYEAVRADVCQELCLMLIAGEVTEDSLQQAVPGATRRAYGQYAISMDWRAADGYAMADAVLAWEHHI